MNKSNTACNENENPFKEQVKDVMIKGTKDNYGYKNEEILKDKMYADLNLSNKDF